MEGGKGSTSRCQTSLTTFMLKCVVTCVCADLPSELDTKAEKTHTHTCMHVENRGVCFTVVSWEAAVF